MIVAAMEESGISRLCSYDRDFDAIPGLDRLEPPALLGGQQQPES